MGDSEVGHADHGRAQQDDVLSAFDEAQTGQLTDLLAVDRGVYARAL